MLDFEMEWSSALSSQRDIAVEVKFNWGNEPSLSFQ